MKTSKDNNYTEQKTTWFSEAAKNNYQILHSFNFESIAGRIYNTATDYIGEYFNNKNKREFLPETVFEVMLVRLMSEDDWLWFSVLAGDIFGSFRRLRFMLELLAIGVYLWNKKFDKTIKEFFKKQNISAILKDAAHKLNINVDELKELYNKLSEFVHYGKGEWKRIIEKGLFPSQHIPFAPQTYTKEDIPFIEEFLDYYNKLANIVDIATEKYKKENW